MTGTFDLIVLGAGPAGIAAALAARRHDLKVAVLDQARAAGGQIYRAPTFRVAAVGQAPDLARGETLRAALEQSGAALFFDYKVWFVAPGVSVAAVGPQGPARFEAPGIVVATGTTERVIPVPGVTLPGVLGLAAATILLKAHAAVPAGPTVVAGVGPLLYAVAAGLLKAGGKVAAVVDLCRSKDWVAAVPSLAGRPDLLAQGLSWMATLRRAGVPLFFGHAVTAIGGADAVEDVEIRPVDPEWRPRPDARAILVQARSVAIGHGLVPATEALRLLGVPHAFRSAQGGWTPQVQPDGSTAIAGVYVAGDCAGVAGAAAAGLSGEIAGLGVARVAGALSARTYDRATRGLHRRFLRAHRFGSGISRLMALRPGLVRAIPDATIVCRCEDISRAAIDAAVAAGARHVGQLKSTTRCGMGPCQGRMCAEAAAELVALGSGADRAAAGQWTARTPILPVPLAAMIGDYDYDDIPKPKPAPA